ncbi:PilZ domain-containing protein [Sulfurivirga sp.]|uniref:PilZ domain-containing protein n=1 Tax=Sulfurivirga sp. TaxID=2614236 RepID=UPI0025F9C75D|nr:PilZ domain-containing protein [Sulfurivirga sp.]
MAQTQIQERRSAPRIPVNHSILAEVPSQEKVFGTTSDVSFNGVGFFAEKPLPPGAPLAVHLELEDPEDHRYHDYDLEGFVAHCIDTMENGYHIGVQLKQPPQDYVTVVEHLTRTH